MNSSQQKMTNENLSQQMTRCLTSIAEFSGNIINSTQIINVQETLQKTLQVISQSINKTFDNYLKSDTIRRLFESLKIEFGYYESLSERFIEYGMILPRDFDREHLDLISYYLAKNQKLQAVNVIINFYRQNNYHVLEKKVIRWNENKIFKMRGKILSDALGAHREKKYSLAIPCLIAQIEGILLEVDTPQKKSTRKVDEIINDYFNENEDLPLLEYYSFKTIIPFIERFVGWHGFVDQIRLTPKKRSITRHTILHGICTNYPSAML